VRLGLEKEEKTRANVASTLPSACVRGLCGKK